MTYDQHVDCDRKLNEAEDRNKELEAGVLQVIKDSNNAQIEAAKRIEELEAENKQLKK